MSIRINFNRLNRPRITDRIDNNNQDEQIHNKIDIDQKPGKIETDHRLKLRIYEAKNFFHCNKADSFCVITTNYLSEDGKTIERPLVKVGKPLIRKMSNAFNSGAVVRKGSYTSTLIDKNTLEMLASQTEKKEKLKGIQFETKIQPCNSNPFWGEYFEIILEKNFYSVKSIINILS
ncbi:hypothetical protein PIROE2DRAFT_18686 [Piromyces sp. E2]|nr:hypothetical protein PIROE2DRAFT_18686 [Piromyces sp. E2]|eukprot:OUM56613.1 hypothetical protein PIROE2DRAFT_18686 [Piromyces sp. E2]